MHKNADTAVVDFETRSACNIKKSGAWRYSLDPTTQVLCLVYRLPHWEPGVTALWHPAFPQCGMDEHIEVESLLELLDWIEQGLPVEAHNAFFERAIWTNILTPQYGFPLPAWDQWRCSAAKAAAHALPRQLADAGAALKLAIQKDDEGHKLMLKLSKPRKPRKKEREAWVAGGNSLTSIPLLWWEDSALFNRLFQYCKQDVLAEEALSHALSDLSAEETAYYSLDQKMNQRGFQLDMDGVATALKLIDGESKLLNSELQTLTEGVVDRATQRERIKLWMESEGLTLYDTKGATIDEILKCDDDEDGVGVVPFGDGFSIPGGVEALSPKVRRALEILRTLGRSSTAKYETMQAWACPDGRVRGGLLYHGATTGRWSGAGVQPQNFPKGTIKGFDMEAAWELLKTGDRDRIITHEWGKDKQTASVMETLACALRGAIVAPAGQQLYVADYAGIEARVLAWLARQNDAVEMFHNGGDPYCDLATAIYGRTITKDDKTERQLGKAGVLGCGYQMGASKFVDTAAMYGVTIDEDFSQQVVDTYREKYWRVKALWYETQDAAIEAVQRRGHTIYQDRVKWQRVGTFLFCTLPCGRRLAWPFPELREKETPWGSKQWQLTFMGVDMYSKKWKRQSTYGGKLVENLVQAISRDLMAAALQRCEASGTYVPILSVHDEVIAEAAEGAGSVKEFEGLLTVLPTWAKGCPVGAEGWAGPRYKK